MAVAATAEIIAFEILPESNQTHVHEQYAHSLSTIRSLGELAADIEVSGQYELAKDDFLTAIAEMLKTDTDLRHEFDIDHPKTFKKIDGKVVNAEGVPMVGVVRRGLDNSMASSDSRIASTQALRDAGDVYTAEKVDALAPGQTLLAVTMEPVEELSGVDTEFWENRGYRKGLAYLQWYHADEEQVTAGALSIDHSNFAALEALLSAWGANVEGATPNTLIRSELILENNTLAEAHALARKFRTEYYTSIDATVQKKDLTEFIKSHHEMTDSAFTSYYPEIARAVAKRVNSAGLQSFAIDILQSPAIHKMDVNLRKTLLRVANQRKFDDEMGRAMDDAIRYSVVELLRAELITTANNAYGLSNSLNHLYTLGIDQAAYIHAASLQQQLVGALNAGVQAQRSYGGCSNTSLSRQGLEINGLKDVLRPQDIYGGKTEEKSETEDDGPDGMGPLTFKCTEGHTNTRKKGQLLEKCQKHGCKEGSVGCK